MKALVLTAVKNLEVKDVDMPEIKPDEVLVHTAYAGICGTDHALYAGLPGSADAVPPIVLGHENSGVVAKVGSEVKNVKVGDRVSVDPNIYCGECKYCRTSRQNFVNTWMLLVLLVMVASKTTSLHQLRLFTQFLTVFH